MGQQLESELLPPALITRKRNKDGVGGGSLEPPPDWLWGQGCNWLLKVPKALLPAPPWLSAAFSIKGIWTVLWLWHGLLSSQGAIRQCWKLRQRGLKCKVGENKPTPQVLISGAAQKGWFELFQRVVFQ